MEKIVEKEIIFRSNDCSDSLKFETVKLTFTDRDLDKVKKAMQVCKDNDFVVNVRIEFDNFDFLDDDGEEVTDWRVDVSQLIVYKDSCYFYAQNKWDSGDQLESDEINISELLEEGE